MSSTIRNLAPKYLWSNFSDLNAVPRASQKEEQVIRFIKSFGEELGLETIEDGTGNVLIKKPATTGMELKATVILQGHLDMVHQKNADTIFDFRTQGIDMYVDGDWVKAKGTTLGADNGIGVAAMMAVLAAKDLVHPAIEAIFTIDEEVGMTGAMGLKKDFLSGSILLNLDSEEDHTLTIGCAGGVDVVIEGSYEQEELSDNYVFYQLNVQGLTGGHSGVDIHRGRCNAIKIVCRLLTEIDKEIEIKISAIDGGDRTSAIPRECSASIAVKKNLESSLRDQISHWQTLLSEENSLSDPDISIALNAIDERSTVLPKHIQEKLLASLYTCPNGIYRMTPGMNNLVQSSNNVGTIKVGSGGMRIACFTRSFIHSERNDLVNVIKNSFASLEVNISEVNPFPGWKPTPNTKTVKRMTEIYESLFGNPPEIFAIHAGLECGILSETYPDVEIVSFGPNVTGAHSPEEALQISSTQKFWKYLTTVLAEL